MFATVVEQAARTRAFARVLGPFVFIVAAVVAIRTPEMGALVQAFFENVALVWMAGAIMVLGGMLIIAQHQYWSNLAAVLISLLGWYVGLRGLALLIVPNLFEMAGMDVMGIADATLWIRIVAFVFALIGLYLTYVGWRSLPTSG